MPIKVPRAGAKNKMDILLNNIAEVKITYSHNVPANERLIITCSKDAYHATQLFFDSAQIEHKEYFYILLMNRANKVLKFNKISEGGLSGTITDIRLIFQAAIKSNASAIICIHNHPSGNTNPSQADLNVTKKVQEAGKLLDIAVLDHMIVTSDAYYSLADNDQM